MAERAEGGSVMRLSVTRSVARRDLGGDTRDRCNVNTCASMRFYTGISYKV
jgi:hypothetical protein